jgi:hypothetical protein
MTATAENDRLLPIACTLGPDDGRRRIDDWRRLGNGFGLGRVRADGTITVRFRDEPGVLQELERLVAAERICCPFLRWEITPLPSEWRLVISGEEDALGALSVAL